MYRRLIVAGAVALCAIAIAARPTAAQAPCSLLPAVADSAREDLLLVLKSDRPLVNELRQEQGLSRPESLSPITVVRERYVCARLAGAFTRMIPPGTSFAVLRVGSLYYARDPDQRRGTGVITDSLFRVLMRLGAAVESRP